MEGWIKIHRKFSDWEWFNISEMVHLFIYLLINANHQDGEWRGIVVKRGQILTGLNSLNENTKISVQTLRTCLKRLEKTKEINIQSTNKYSIITICKYDDYQSEQQTTNKQTNKRSTNNQQSTNNKQECKEGEEGKELILNTWRDDYQIYLKECKEAFVKFDSDKLMIEKQERLNPNVDIKLTIEKAYDKFWKTEAGWKNKKKAKTENIDWEATIKNAISVKSNIVYKTKLF